ncbi:MAG TPA: hypothetical protein VFG29_03730 [Syntrophales bacterium]|nr:hypothetical protein [Syntrophales bacterium]
MSLLKWLQPARGVDTKNRQWSTREKWIHLIIYCVVALFLAFLPEWMGRSHPIYWLAYFIAMAVAFVDGLRKGYFPF